MHGVGLDEDVRIWFDFRSAQNEGEPELERIMRTLKEIDLSKSLDKAEYKARMKRLELRLGELQRRRAEAQVPVIIVFEGWDAAGKGTMNQQAPARA